MPWTRKAREVGAIDCDSARERVQSDAGRACSLGFGLEPRKDVEVREQLHVQVSKKGVSEIASQRGEQIVRTEADGELTLTDCSLGGFRNCWAQTHQSKSVSSIS